jgi:hypothetical protein
LHLPSSEISDKRDSQPLAVRALRAVSIVALAAYAAHSLFGLGHATTGLFEHWIYNGTIAADGRAPPAGPGDGRRPDRQHVRPVDDAPAEWPVSPQDLARDPSARSGSE